jgi:uncharacterized protein YacL
MNLLPALKNGISGSFLKKMSKFHFWATLITAAILGIIGFLLGEALPLPEPFTPATSRVFYALIGMLIGLLTYAQIASWVVKTTTRLIANLITRLASEMASQFTQLASRGWNLFPGPAERVSLGTSGENLDTERLNSSIILDTSSIIDGRVLDVAKAGFLSGIILVPNFVLAELRQVADSADSLKRARGRMGFKIIDDLKKVHGSRVKIWDEPAASGKKEVMGKTVDDKLIKMGKILHGKILTCDFNLNRNASVSGVRVLNINELGNALKTLSIPGEKLTVKIIQQGKDKDQGVGYLFDGTMVVVKGASSMINQEVITEVTKVLQGPSGRMIFGKIVE